MRTSSQTSGIDYYTRPANDDDIKGRSGTRTKYTYDQGTNAIGHLSKVTDASGQTALTYDPLGRIVQKQQLVGGVTLTVGYGYQNSQLTSLSTPSGQALSYAYDASGRLSGINVNGVPLLGSVGYSPFGPISGWTWGNGTQTARDYDLDGRLTEVVSAGTSTYSFFDDGSIASRSDDTEHDYSVIAGTTAVAVSATSNQLANTTGTMARTFAYDQAGNTLSNGASTFTYNGAGRLNSATQGTTASTFAVNALGQRVSKASASGTTLFGYDEAGHLIGEYNAIGGLIEETVWLGDTPVATLRPNASGTVDFYYVHADHLNTPRRVTRASDNTIVWRWSSDPYGLGFVDEDPDGDGQALVYNLRFPGQYADGETGLNYNYERDYDPMTGRYVEPDPMGQLVYFSLSLSSYLRHALPSTTRAGYWNKLYAYTDDNPLSDSDPYGLGPWGWFGEKGQEKAQDAAITGILASGCIAENCKRRVSHRSLLDAYGDCASLLDRITKQQGAAIPGGMQALGGVNGILTECAEKCSKELPKACPNCK
jgi:RHS repeat-associated protein